MKTLKYFLIVIIAILFSEIGNAQVSVNINIGPSAPRYYYLQDIHAYYDIQNTMYIFLSGSKWVHARHLPASYGRYDIKKRHKVIIRDYRGNSPYVYFREHKSKFPKGYYSSKGKNYWAPKNNKVKGKKNIKSSKNFKGENKSYSKGKKSKGKGHGKGK